MWFFLLIFLVIVCACVWYRRKQKILSDLPAHFPSLPLLGSSYYLHIDPVKQRKQFWDICYHRNLKAGICSLWLGHWPFILIYNPEFVQDLLNSNQIRKALDYRFAKPWLGEGLITSYGEKWYFHRKLIGPSFNLSILNEFLPVINAHVGVFIQRLESLADTMAEFDIFSLATLVTLDVICETAMGVSLELQKGANEDYVEAVVDINRIIDNRFKSLHQWPEILFRFSSAGRRHAECLRILHGYSKKVVEERAASFDNSSVETKMKSTATTSTDCTSSFASARKKNRLALLDTLLLASDDFTKLSLKEIQEEVDTFLFAGHDTTAITLSWTMYLLSKNESSQRKVQEELDEIFGTSSREATMDDLRNMKFLECCIKESLRMFPSVPLFARDFTEDTRIGCYDIPKGTNVIVLIELMNYNPEYFVDPFTFHPERFLTPTPESFMAPKTHPYSFVPFSAGQRNCVGQRFAMLELKVLLSSIFRRFSAQYSTSRSDPTPSMELLFRPKDGIYISLEHRKLS